MNAIASNYAPLRYDAAHLEFMVYSRIKNLATYKLVFDKNARPVYLEVLVVW